MVRVNSYLPKLTSRLWQNPAVAGGIGCCIIAAHLYYLNNASWPLNPRLDIPLLTHVRLIAFLCLFLTLLLWFKRLEKRSPVPSRPVRWSFSLRYVLGAAFFCFSVTALDPPKIRIIPHRAVNPFYIYSIDLAPYYIINMVGYALIFSALFRLGWVKSFSSRIGSFVLRMLKYPGYRFALFAFVWVLGVSYYLSWAMFRHTPWIYDTIVQLFHAKCIAAGRWYCISPPEYLREFFPLIFVVNDGKWYSQYPPGHMIMLAAGILLNNPAIVNPFLGACTCVAVWLLAKELYGAHVARIAALLSAMCVYLIVFSSEFMNNATSLLMGTLFLWGYFRVLHRPNIIIALIAGAALGFCFITRPFSAYGLALPICFYTLNLISVQPRKYMLPMLVMFAGFFAFFAFQLHFNKQTTGHPFIFGYEKVHGQDYNPFTSSIPWTQDTQYKRLLFNAQRLSYLNRILFEWPLPVPVGLMALVFAFRARKTQELLLISVIVSMFLSVQFVRNLDISWGPRLVYEIIGIIIALCAKGLTMLPPLIRRLAAKPVKLRSCYGGGVIVLALFYTFSMQYNLKPATVHDFYDLKHKEWNPGFYKAIARNVKTPALVFVPEQYYVYVAFTNPPAKSNPVIFAVDLEDRNRLLTQFFSRRKAYKLSTDTGKVMLKRMR